MDFFDSFTLTAVLIACFAFFYLFTIVDPDLERLHKKIDAEFESMPFRDKVTSISKTVKCELSEKPILNLCILGATITRL